MNIEQGVIKFENFVISESPVMPGFFLIMMLYVNKYWISILNDLGAFTICSPWNFKNSL